MSNETRKLPTRPGWWWYHDPSSPHAVCVYVGKSEISGDLIIETTGGIVPAYETDGDWLSLVPGPAVLAALAEYADALVACSALAAPEDYEDDTAMLTFVASRDARRALDAAIRAERDGAA